MIAQKTEHKHRFVKPVKAKVMLRDKDGIISGYDILKLHQCTCKKARAYDLARQVMA